MGRAASLDGDIRAGTLLQTACRGVAKKAEREQDTAWQVIGGHRRGKVFDRQMLR